MALSEDKSKIINCKEKGEKDKKMIFEVVYKNHLNSYEVHTYK
jgi:hypothetical protein